MLSLESYWVLHFILRGDLENSAIGISMRWPVRCNIIKLLMHTTDDVNDRANSQG